MILYQRRLVATPPFLESGVLPIKNMEKEIKKLPKCKVEISFIFPWGEFEDYYDQALSKLNQGVALDGFRPGKAPKEIIEQKFGEARILEDAADLALQDKYPALVVDNSLEIIGQPQVEILKLARGNDFECKIKVEVLPEVRLPNYQKIAQGVKKEEIKVEDKELDEALDWVRKSRATFEDLDRAAQKEDMVEISYQSPQLENNKQFEDRFFLGKGQLMPGFEEQVEGMEAGEEKEFAITFPKDYFQKDLADKPATFKLKIQKVQKAIFPELTDEFAKTLGEFENLEDLRKNVADGIKQEKEQDSNQKRREVILEKVMAQAEMEIPEVLLTEERARIMHQLEHDAKDQLGISFEEYVKQNFKNEKELQEKIEKQATERIKSYLIIKAVGQQEGVEVSDTEIDEACRQFLAKYSRTRDVEKEIDPERLRGYYRGIIYNEKVFQKLESI
ncbi:MAG: trigger factor [Candidatus Pacebacteria bacterium]|nr:trigger factor [Candidatus Paceibacterota bacterium]